MRRRLARAARTEFAFAILFTLLGLFVLYDAYTLEESGVYSVISPKTFEYMIGTFATLVGIVLIIEVLRGKLGIAEGTDIDSTFVPPDIKTMSIVLGSMAVHVALIEKVGYIAAATITFFSVAYAFGSKKFLKDLIISFLFATLVYVVFSKGLRIFLPEGFIEDMLRLSRPEAG